MTTLEEAYQLVDQHCTALPVIVLPLEQTMGHVVANDYKAKEPQPRFDMSAMDGYGVCNNDLSKASEKNPVVLRVQYSCRPGSLNNNPLEPCSAIKIMTGAPIPAGVDAVVMQEFVRENDGMVTFFSAVHQGHNIRYAGSEFNTGDLIIRKGTLITPPIAGLLATLGISNVEVYQKPVVGLVISGNELQTPDTVVTHAQVRDANSYTLRSALFTMGIVTNNIWFINDDPNETRRVLQEALQLCDVLITTGGISVGDSDCIKNALSAVGVQTIFWKVSIKPGKPVYCGLKTNTKRQQPVLVFGLPGNPVAALLNFTLFVKRALYQLQGLFPEQTTPVRGYLSKPLHVSAGRTEFIRAKLQLNGKLIVIPLERQESNVLTSLADANCWVVCHGDCEHLLPGDEVEVLPIYWN